VDYDIYLVNYHAYYLGPNDLLRIGTNELERLFSERVFERYDEIYVIAHSIGGTVTKIMLSWLNREDVKLFRRVKGVVYLSTPAKGATRALALNPQLRNLEDLNRFLTSVEDFWIETLEARDAAKAESPQVYCAYETLTTGAVLVVPRELVDSRCDAPPYPMPFNHIGMVKPLRRDNDPYLWAMGMLLEAGAGGSSRRNATRLLRLAEESVIAGEHVAARQNYEKARTLYRKIDDRVGEADVLTGLGDLERLLGHNQKAEIAYSDARRLYRAVGNRQGEATVLRGLGDLDAAVARYEEARVAYTEARTLYKAVGNRQGEATVLLGMGDLDATAARYEEARAAYTEARRLYRAVGNRQGEATVLLGMGELERRMRRIDDARAAYTEARLLFRAVGSPLGEANALGQLGRLERQLARSDEARTALMEARSLFNAADNRLGEATANLELGRLEATINPELAKKYFHQAALIYEQIGMDQWKEIALSEAKKLSQ
jgi:tetratricopeptide (TPR) repeat protein